MVRYAIYRHWANESRKAAHATAVQHSTSSTADPIDLDNKQFLELLTRFAGTLPPKYRLIFIHHKLLDQPLDEIARELGISPRTAERYVAKLMEIMRKQRGDIALYTVLTFLSFNQLNSLYNYQ
jgi:RNA polymerase sigma factor (sigma-70 family)